MKKSIALSISLLALIAVSCVDNKNSKATTEPAAYKIEIADFGGKVDSQQVKQCAITNPSGMTVKILNYGGTVTNILTADKEGKYGDVILGFDSLSGYLQSGNPYIGSLVGRYANRIANASFTLDGQKYQLASNNNGNSLHGGNKGFDKVVWTMEPQAGDSSVKLIYISKDGEEGYPGTLTAEVIYTLTWDNSLKIEYKATTDKATPVNLTNHCYFNLSAGTDSTILAHELSIKARKFTEVNDKLIPTGTHPDVSAGPMDFTQAKPIGRDLLQVAGGYDHNWVLDKTGNVLELIGTLYHPTSGRYMEVFTTEPGLQFYSGNFLDGTLKGAKNGTTYVKHAGLCLETQHFPDSPNHPDFPNTILKPGETYSHTTLYKFSTK